MDKLKKTYEHFLAGWKFCFLIKSILYFDVAILYFCTATFDSKSKAPFKLPFSQLLLGKKTRLETSIFKTIKQFLQIDHNHSKAVHIVFEPTVLTKSFLKK